MFVPGCLAEEKLRATTAPGFLFSATNFLAAPRVVAFQISILVFLFAACFLSANDFAGSSLALYSLAPLTAAVIEAFKSTDLPAAVLYPIPFRMPIVSSAIVLRA